METEFTDLAVCPHCGFEDKDSWEIGRGGEGESITDCASCGKEMVVYRHVAVSYSTSKPNR